MSPLLCGVLCVGVAHTPSSECDGTIDQQLLFTAPARHGRVRLEFANLQGWVSVPDNVGGGVQTPDGTKLVFSNQGTPQPNQVWSAGNWSSEFPFPDNVWSFFNGSESGRVAHLERKVTHLPADGWMDLTDGITEPGTPVQVWSPDPDFLAKNARWSLEEEGFTYDE